MKIRYLKGVFTKIFDMVKQKQADNAIVKFMKTVSLGRWNVPGSLPCDIFDTINQLKSEGLDEFQGITADVFITKRAMTNFPDLMPIFQKYFGAKVVEQPHKLEKNQRALEWCLNLPTTFQDARFYHHIGRYPTKDERNVPQDKYTEESIETRALQMYCWTRYGKSYDCTAAISLKWPENPKLFERSDPVPPDSATWWYAGTGAVLAIAAWRLMRLSL